jgi:hypothetical protein
MSDADLLQRYMPYLYYDSFETYRADSAAVLPEHYLAEGGWSRTNQLKRKGGDVIAAARPGSGQTKLDLAFLAPSKYENGVESRKTDYIDAAGKQYAADARRMHAKAAYANRIYGHVAREANGTVWLQYYFFYYYNDKSFLGVGLHEGDWEMIQLRLGPDDAPNAATYAQHDRAQAFAYTDLEQRSSKDGPVPVVYVGRGSHASFASAGEHWPLAPLPPDYANGKGPRLRPKLEVIDSTAPAWAMWEGKWGSSESSPHGPGTKDQWADPGAFHAAHGGAPVTRGGRAAVRTLAVARPALPVPPAPRLSVSRADDRALVSYTFPQKLAEGAAQPTQLVVAIDSRGDGLPPLSQTFTVRGRKGVAALPLELEDRQYTVRAVAYSEDGIESKNVSATLRRPR